MSGHTPGQWVTYTAHDGTRNVRAGNAYVCQFGHKNGGDRDVAEADGRLIAAAPDLLACCLRAVNESARVHPDFMQQLEDAIAKAMP